MKHKVLSKVALCGILLLPFASAAVVQAAGTWTVTEEKLAPYGEWSSWGSSNTKKTNSEYASFNGDNIPRLKWKIKVRLINNKAQKRSEYTSLEKNRTTHAGDNTGVKNRKYWADSRTYKLDSHGPTIKFHFSADYKQMYLDEEEKSE